MVPLMIFSAFKKKKSNLNNQYTILVKDKSQLRSLTTLFPLLIYWEELQKEWLIGVTL